MRTNRLTRALVILPALLLLIGQRCAFAQEVQAETAASPTAEAPKIPLSNWIR